MRMLNKKQLEKNICMIKKNINQAKKLIKNDPNNKHLKDFLDSHIQTLKKYENELDQKSKGNTN